MDKVVHVGMKIDLHIHSAASSHKDGTKVKDGTLANIDTLKTKLEEKEVNICAITDHDVFDFNLYKSMKEMEANEESFVRKVLPGVEFSVQFEGDEGSRIVHVITIFNDEDETKVQAIASILKNPPEYDAPNAFTKDCFLKILRAIDLDVLMIAHQKGSLMSKGSPKPTDANSLGNDTFNEFLFTEYFEAYEFRNRQNEVYHRLYAKDLDASDALRLVTGSDCHNWSVYPDIDICTGEEYPFTYVKCLPSFKGLVMAFTDNRRIKLVNSFFNPSATVCDELELTIEGEKTSIPLSKGINAIIGDNSIGKSLLLHALNDYRGTKASLKSGYEKYLKESHLAIDTVLPEESIFQFDSQGEIKSQFENMNAKESKKLLADHFPDPIDVDQYKGPIKVVVSTYCSALKKFIDYNENIQTPHSFAIIDNVGKSSSLVPLVDGLQKPKTKRISELLVELQKALTSLAALTTQYADVLEEKDAKELAVFTKAIEELKTKYETAQTRVHLERQKIEIVKSCFNDLVKEQAKIVGDQEKMLTQFRTDCANAVNAIVELKKMQLNLNIPDTVIKETKIKPNKNHVGKFVFVAKTVTEKVSPDYFESTIKQVLGKGKVIDWNSETTASLKEKILRFPSDRNDVLIVFEERIIEQIDKDFEQKNSVIENGIDVYRELSAGVNAQIYFTLVSDVSKNRGMYFIDQPEDQISQPAIKTVVLGCFKEIGEARQVLLVTHNPQFIVNLDVDNVIFLSRKDEHIQIQSGALEYECSDYSMLSIVAENVEGGIDTINKRMRRYEKAL